MLIFTLRRLNLFIFTMLLLTILSFSLSSLFPGDPLTNLSGQVNISDSQRQDLMEEYKFDENVVQQYWAYLTHLYDGDLGVSMVSHLPISSEIILELLLDHLLELFLLSISVLVFRIRLHFLMIIIPIEIIHDVLNAFPCRFGFSFK